MTLTINNVYNGFKLLEDIFVEEIQSQAKIFEHEKTKAKLLFLENDDDNKVFSITFRTPPNDSTGAPHIIEHSVLCGSKKFQLKEPFVELLKGSLNTFLNAMTFPDKTMYPVASRNNKDFLNLMDVYLDAVFNPLILTTPEILMQEGWHYDLTKKEDPLKYKGVVYNEMKGVFSSPDATLEQKIFETLFPDTTYSVESGGDPDDIPNLTYEKFISFYKKHYHPSNSFIFLYGDLDILDKLNFIDENYLVNFEEEQIDSEITIQIPPKSLKEKNFEFYYPVSPNDSVNDKTFITINSVTKTSLDKEIYLAIKVLEYMLLETPAAPLKQAIINKGIGKEVFGSFTNSILQPVFTIGVNGANDTDKDLFIQTVTNTLKSLVKNGIDKKLIESTINIFEFQLREANYGSRPKGLIYNIKCMDSWLYGENPLLHLAFNEVLETIKASLKTSYWEELIEKYLLNNSHTSIIVLKPDQNLANNKNNELKAKLADIKNKMSDDDLNKIINQTNSLKQRQETPDSKENLESIPLLKLEDIAKNSEILPLVEKNINNSKILLHPIPTNEIAYTSLYFDASKLPEDLLLYGHLLADILGKISVEKYNYSDLATEINLNTGGFSYSLTALSNKEDDSIYLPKLTIKGKSLINKMPEMFMLLGQIANTSNFDNLNRLKELIKELKANWDNALFSRGHLIASSRVLSYVSPVAKFNEISKFTFYKFISDLENNLENKIDEIRDNLTKAAKYIFTKSNLITSITLDEKYYDNFSAAFSNLYNQLNDNTNNRNNYDFSSEKNNEAIMTPGKVQFVAKGGNYRRLGFNYTGSMKVLESILRYDYLWSQIRVKGGAYGAFSQIDRNGNIVFTSYRDPNLLETLEVYNSAANYLKDFNDKTVSSREMTKYIIGAVSSLDTPLTSQLKGEIADINYFRNISYEDIQQERTEILSTKQKDICELSNLLEKVMSEDCICVLGSEEKIKEIQEEKNIFQKLINASIDD